MGEGGGGGRGGGFETSEPSLAPASTGFEFLMATLPSCILRTLRE